VRSQQRVLLPADASTNRPAKLRRRQASSRSRRRSRRSLGCYRSKPLSGRWPSSPACLCQPVPKGQRPCLPLERAERGEGVRVAFPASGFTNTRREPGGPHGSSGRTQVANSWGESDASQRLIRKQVGRAWGQAAGLLPPALPRPSRCRHPGKRKAAVSGGFVRLRGRDSNPNFLIQSQASYH
jgi:hypothetical protein